MAYGKVSRYRRRRSNLYGRKRRNRAYKMRRTVRFLRKVVSADRHWFDRVLTAGTIDSQPSIYVLNNNIIQGDQPSMRSGNVIKTSYLNVKVELNKPAARSSALCRIIVVRDWGAPGGVIPNPNLIMDGTVFGTTNSPNAIRYINQLKRFRIIADRKFVLDNGSISRKMVNIRVRLKGDIQYFSANGTDWDKGTIYMIVMDDNITGLNDTIINFISRLTYYP